MPKSLLKAPKGFRKPRVSDFKKDFERLGEDIAESFKRQIISNIEDNKYKFVLSESTILSKGSPLPFVNTGELVSSIFREGHIVSVEETARKYGITNLELAMILEYGRKDKSIPARPLWRNTFRDFKEEARGYIDKFLETGKFSSYGQGKRVHPKGKRRKSNKG